MDIRALFACVLIHGSNAGDGYALWSLGRPALAFFARASERGPYFAQTFLLAGVSSILLMCSVFEFVRCRMTASGRRGLLVNFLAWNTCAWARAY